MVVRRGGVPAVGDKQYKYAWQCQDCGATIKRHSRRIQVDRQVYGKSRCTLREISPVGSRSTQRQAEATQCTQSLCPRSIGGLTAKVATTSTGWHQDFSTQKSRRNVPRASPEKVEMYVCFGDASTIPNECALSTRWKHARLEHFHALHKDNSGRHGTPYA